MTYSAPEIETQEEKDVSECYLEAQDAVPADDTAATHHVHDMYGEEESGIDPVYQRKVGVLNDALQDIGMGKYQWGLFFLCGFGWFADNLWPQVNGLILTSVVNEFRSQGPFLILAQTVGFLVGAAFWGVAADVWGRRWGFNLTLLLTGIFAVAAGGSPNFTTLCSLVAVANVGTGGNLPVDSAVFIEFVPASHQYLIAVLSLWWAVAQLVAALVAWPLISNFSCAAGSPCPSSSNMGWRYLVFAMGGLSLALWILRFLVFHLYESPKFLVGRGRDEDAVKVVHQIAAYNGRTSRLTLKKLQEVGEFKSAQGQPVQIDTSAKGAIMRVLRGFSTEHVKALFATRKLAYSTGLLITIWALMGLAYPLYNYFIPYFLATRGANFGDGSVYITYRNQVILSVIGIPGALLAGLLVELPHIGRKGALAIFTASTGVFLYAGTTARTSNALLGWNCGYTFTSNAMYGVLYTITPELFPSKHRGTGVSLVSTANRTFGVMAPIIALYANLNTPVPIYVSGGLFLFTGAIALLLPFESRGKAAM